MSEDNITEMPRPEVQSPTIEEILVNFHRSIITQLRAGFSSLLYATAHKGTDDFSFGYAQAVIDQADPKFIFQVLIDHYIAVAQSTKNVKRKAEAVKKVQMWKDAFEKQYPEPTKAKPAEENK